MGTKVIFEASTFLDFITRAGRVAPTRGPAFDKASGIVIEITPGDEFQAVVRSTNLDVYFMTWAKALVVEGEATTWRLHAEMIGNIARSLRVTSGQKVTLQTAGNRLQITQGRIKAVVNLMVHQDYPIWKAFNPGWLSDAGNLFDALTKVEWAADDSAASILVGVRFDGKSVLSTNRYKFAMFPYEVPDLNDEFVLKSKVLTSALTSQSSIKVGFEGDFMHIMPDEQTQIRVLGLDGEYLNVSPVMIRERPCTVKVRRNSMIDLVNRVLSVRGADRSPLVRIRFGRGEISGYLINDDMGMFGDVIEVPGSCDHERIEYGFSHEALLDMLNAAPGDDITIGHDPGSLKRPFYFSANSGWESWLATRGDAPRE